MAALKTKTKYKENLDTNSPLTCVIQIHGGETNNK